MPTWREVIRVQMATHGETLVDVVAAAPPLGAWLDVDFDTGFGSTEGCEFTIWTARRVYFPCEYDGAEWCGSVSRHPDGRPTEHI